MYRTHNCGQLRIENKGQEVTLAGWMHKSRDLGGMTFVDLRDRYGKTQLVFNMETNKDLCEKARKLGREFVIQVKGTVAERSNKNAEMPTGDIEIIVSELNVLNASVTPPFTIEDETDGGEELRMKYRYLDIRRSQMANRLLLRAKTVKSIREYLDSKDFVEIETPNLIKSTPEGARDFLVPSRLQPGKFYALPQSPQILKQLLMVGGMDRYYQIVKCFRDEDFRGDRQPEFTQLDCEMSFVEQEDIFNMFEGMTKHVYKKVLNVELEDFIRLRYDDALKYYGTDKPDLRFDCKIIDMNEFFQNSGFVVFDSANDEGKLIAGIVAKGCSEYTRKQIDALTDFVKEPHRGAGGLIYIKYNTDGTVKSSIDKFFTEEQLLALAEKTGATKGDVVFIIVDKESKARKVLGDLRLHIGKQENWIAQKPWSVLWVIDFPLFERDEETGENIFVHHPFCSPHHEDLQYLETDPLRVRAQTYDLVINGNELVSGSIRIHNPELQNKIFDLLGFSEEDREEQFGFMTNAFRYGAPPHGGCAFGLDRWVMLMAEGQTIRDVIAFPKNNAGRDLMMDAPSIVDPKQLADLGIGIAESSAKK
jgi:aspartyl-tRNA synthetase